MQCHACNGKEFTPRTVELTTKVGPYKVLDRSHRRPVCDSCGEYTLPAKTLERVELQAAQVAYGDAPKVTGDMLRFARKALDMTQVELAEQLGTTAESVSRWERDERPMEKWLHVAVKGLLLDRLSPDPQDVELKRAG